MLGRSASKVNLIKEVSSKAPLILFSAFLSFLLRKSPFKGTFRIFLFEIKEEKSKFA